jgi:hypothetical protein
LNKLIFFLMKKARFIGGAVVALAIVGGVFAFKANRQPVTLYVPLTPNGACSIATTVPYTITANTLAPTAQVSISRTTTSCLTHTTATL